MVTFFVLLIQICYNKNDLKKGETYESNITTRY